jgi:hypothetical protein
MIIETLKLISLGKLSLSEVAQKLNIGRDEMKNRLEIMKQTGYVEAVPGEYGDEPEICSSCPLRKSCSESRAVYSASKGYRITEKGRRVLTHGQNNRDSDL